MCDSDTMWHISLWDKIGVTMWPGDMRFGEPEKPGVGLN